MKVLYVYALLIGFTTGAKVFTKKNGKKREHHGKLNILICMNKLVT